MFCRISQDLSAVKSETLQQELESVGQLMEMETDNKCKLKIADLYIQNDGWKELIITGVILVNLKNPHTNKF